MSSNQTPHLINLVIWSVFFQCPGINLTAGAHVTGTPPRSPVRPWPDLGHDTGDVGDDRPYHRDVHLANAWATGRSVHAVS